MDAAHGCPPRKGFIVRQTNHECVPKSGLQNYCSNQAAARVNRSTSLTLIWDIPGNARMVSSFFKHVSAFMSPAHSPTTEIVLHLHTSTRQLRRVAFLAGMEHSAIQQTDCISSARPSLATCKNLDGGTSQCVVVTTLSPNPPSFPFDSTNAAKTGTGLKFQGVPSIA